MGTDLEGRCLCGAVHVRASAMPSMTVACHCTFCQRATGAAFAVMSFFRAEHVQQQGVTTPYTHVSDESGKQVHLHRCPSCGVITGASLERLPRFTLVARGILDEPDRVPITRQQFLRSAQQGVVFPPGVDLFEAAMFTPDGRPVPPLRLARPEVSAGRGRPRLEP